MHEFRKYLSRPFTLMDEMVDRIRIVGLNGLFAILFINLFQPFSMGHWFDVSEQHKLLFYSSFGIMALIVFGVSQFLIRPQIGPKNFTIGSFILWSFGEIIVLSLIYTFFFGSNIHSILDYFSEFRYSFKYTAMVALLSYSFALLVGFSVKRTKEDQQVSEPQKEDDTGMIEFLDEKGQFKFSFRKSHILYIEAADNYVVVHVFDGQNHEKHILRNSLKRLEPLLEGSGIMRCHRSFMIREEAIVQIKRETKRYLLILSDGTSIPSSASYYSNLSSQKEEIS